MIKLPDKKYNIIYVDPPWEYPDQDKRLGGSHGQHGIALGVGTYYKTMTLDELSQMEIPSNKDCWIFMWATATKLPDAINLIDRWGFTYWTCAVWDKVHLGLGWFFRVQHEILIVGKKGHPKCPVVKNRSIFVEKRTTHSKKPICVRIWIDKAFPSAMKLELFARQRYAGWDTWGDEVSDTVQHNLNIEGGKTPFTTK